MAVITVDIDSSNRSLILGGATVELMHLPRARVYMRTYLHARSERGTIIIPFEDDALEETLLDLQRAIERFGFEFTPSVQASNTLREHWEEQTRFHEFSHAAYQIRNNQLGTQEREHFKEFTTSLEDQLPNRRLYERQLLSSYHLAFSMNTCNFSVPGAGKTSIVYGAYAYMKSLPPENPKHIDRLMIIGPLSSFRPWEDEYRECFGTEPNSFRISGAIPLQERYDYLLGSHPTELTLVSYYSVLNLIDHLCRFLRRAPTMVVLDEAHKIKNAAGGVIATATLELARYCRSRVILTGTPVPNGYEDLYNLFEFIWPGRNVIGFHLFQLYAMTKDRGHRGIDTLIDNASPFFIRIRKSDLGLPEPQVHDPIIVQMGTIQRQIYNYIETSYMEYFTSSASGGLRDSFARARVVRLMQASTNPALLQRPLEEYYSELGISDKVFIEDSGIAELIRTYYDLEIPSKFQRIAQLIQEILSTPRAKVVVWAIFIRNILDLRDYLDRQGIVTEVIYGATPIEVHDDLGAPTREHIIEEFHRENSRFRVLIANPFAISESISLHRTCHNAIYLERSFNCAQFIQSKDRIHRYGLLEDDLIQYYYILSDNNIDWTIHGRLNEKEERMMQIIEGEPIPLFDLALSDESDDDLAVLIRNYSSGAHRS